MTEIKKTLFASLLAVQKELQTVTKNKTAFKGKYADIENIWESIRQIVNDNGFVVLHEATAEGIKTTAIHESGEKLESFIPWSGNKDSQEQGKEITYAKRYNINAIFNVIVSEEDNDASKKIGNYKKSEVNGELAAKKIREAKTREEAVSLYNGLSKEERLTTEVVKVVAEMKAKYKDAQ